MDESKTLFTSGYVQVREWSDDWPKFQIQLGHIVLLESPDRELANALGRVVSDLCDAGCGGNSDETNRRRIVDGISDLIGMRLLLSQVLARAAERERARGLEAVSDQEREDHCEVARRIRAAAGRLGYRENF